MPQPQKRPSKRHKVLTGITTAVMALAVVVTGGLLGATTKHNQQLKNEVQTLRVQTSQVTANTQAQNEIIQQIQTKKKRISKSVHHKNKPAAIIQSDR